MLGTAKTDTLSTELHCISSVSRGVGIGSNLKNTCIISPFHNTIEVTADGSLNCFDITKINLTGGAVEGDVITFYDVLAAKVKILIFFADLNLAAAGYTTGTHTTCYYCCMRGHTAANGQDTFCCMHTFDVFRRGLKTNENNSFACFVMCLCVLSGEVYLTCCSARGCRKCTTDNLSLCESLSIKVRVKELVKRLSVNTHNCLLRSNHTFIYEVTSDLKSCLCGSLTVTGLKEIQLTFLNGKLHILHITVVVFELACDLKELLVSFRHILFQSGNRLRSTDTCNYVFALCVDEVLTIDTLSTGGRVTGKCNAGTGGVTHVTEYHCLYVNCGTPVTRDIVHTTVNDCTRVVPGTEYCLNSFHQLNLRVLRELFAHLFLIDCFVLSDNFLQIICGKVGIVLSALSFLNLIKDAFEEGLAHLHNNVGEHLDETTIRVVSKSRIAGLLREAFYCNVIQTKVQDGVHHTRHGCTCTGTNGYKERIFGITELLALHLL